MFNTLKHFIYHDAEKLTWNTFKCKRCGKHFEMNKMYRVEITEQKANNNVQFNDIYMNRLLELPPDKMIEILQDMREINFYEGRKYTPDINWKQRICWRR